MIGRAYNVLFLCTGNSARSILAEALLNRMARGRRRAYSAGSFPRGAVHPAALALLGDLGFPTEGLRSKSWDEFAGRKRRRSISSSPSATMPPAKPARCGQAIR